MTLNEAQGVLSLSKDALPLGYLPGIFGFLSTHSHLCLLQTYSVDLRVTIDTVTLLCEHQVSHWQGTH